MPGSATTRGPAESVPPASLTVDSPATVIIARHGLRIDFVDSNWHRTAERPHDSPMTQSGRVMGWRMGVHLWARLRAMHLLPPTTTPSTADDDAKKRVAEVAALLDRVVVLASPLMRAVDTAAYVCQGLEDAAAEELAAYAGSSAAVEAAWDHRLRLPSTLSHPEGHPMVFGKEARAPHSRRIPIHIEPAMTETTYWMCRDMCKKYRRSSLETADQVPSPIVLPAEVLKRTVSDRVIVPLSDEAAAGAGAARTVLCPVEYQFDPRRGTVLEALRPEERFSRAWVNLLAPHRYAAAATSAATTTTPADKSSPYRDKIVLLLGHGQTVAGMAQTLPRVLNGHFAVPVPHVPRVAPMEAPLAGFAMFHRRTFVAGTSDGSTAHTYDTVVDAFSEEHLGSQL